MAKLDPFIEYLFEKRAKSLVLETGSVALLSRPGQAPLPITRRTLTSANIYSALAELMPPSRAATLASTDDELVAYDAPAGRVLIRFTTNGQGVRAQLERAEPAVAQALEQPLPPPDDALQSPMAQPRVAQPNRRARPGIIVPPPPPPAPSDRPSRTPIALPPAHPTQGTSRMNALAILEKEVLPALNARVDGHPGDDGAAGNPSAELETRVRDRLQQAITLLRMGE